MTGLRLAQICAAAATLAMASAADAAVIFDNGVPDLGSASASDFSLPNQIADDFSLGIAATLTTIHWGGIYAVGDTPASDAFVIRIYADKADAPALDPLHEFDVGNIGRTKTGSTIFGRDVYTYDALLPATLLAAGTYWLSVVNDLPSDADGLWFWATSATTDGHAATRRRDGMAWTVTNEYEFSFALTDDVPAAVPAPAGSGLLAVGIGCLAWRRRCGRG